MYLSCQFPAMFGDVRDNWTGPTDHFDMTPADSSVCWHSGG